MQALTPTGDFYFLAFARCKYSVYIANCAAFINLHFTLVLVEFIDDPSLVTGLFTKQIFVYVALFRLYDIEFCHCIFYNTDIIWALVMPSADEESSAVKSSVCTDVEAARKPLARLRCLKNSIDCLTSNEPLSPALCYVPAEVTYAVTRNDKIVVYTTAAKDRTKLSEISCSADHQVVVSGEELYTSEGQWARLLKVCNLCELCLF